MLLSLLFILLGVLLLYGGAEGLVRGSASLARQLGLTPLVIGLTVVAFGTSMPEMVVSIDAALEGNAPIAVGNVVGSNIGNIALILGISALIAPLRIHAQVIRLDLPLLVAVSGILLVLLLNDELSRSEGALLAAGLMAYVALSLRLAGRERPPAEAGKAVPGRRKSLLLDVGLVLGGLVLLVLGARLLVTGAVEVAEALAISEAVIGLTVVAIGTSLPELATSLLAALKGEGDIAIGNVVGSNMFNILGILGIASIVRPLRATGVDLVDLGVMLGATVLLLPLMRTGFTLRRWEGGVLLLGYAAYVIHLLL